jgi:hypothetical protein
MAPAHTRREAADRFWSDVEDLLIRHYQHPAPEARRGLDEYRREVDGRSLGEAVYNQGEEQAARVVDAVIRNGLPTFVRA